MAGRVIGIGPFIPSVLHGRNFLLERMAVRHFRLLGSRDIRVHLRNFAVAAGLARPIDSIARLMSR
jgi:hypothetical protein